MYLLAFTGDISKKENIHNNMQNVHQLLCICLHLQEILEDYVYLQAICVTHAGHGVRCDCNYMCYKRLQAVISKYYT